MPANYLSFYFPETASQEALEKACKEVGLPCYNEGEGSFQISYTDPLQLFKLGVEHACILIQKD